MNRVLLISLGSRGDMEPFLALGEKLSQEGKTIAFCFPTQYEKLAKEVSPVFYGQDPRFLDLINRPEVVSILSQDSSVFRRMSKGIALAKEISPLQEQLILDQESAVIDFKPDHIYFHIKCIYPIFWALTTTGKITLLSPMPCTIHPVKHEPHIGFGEPGSVFWNLITYKLAHLALVRKSILGYGKTFIRLRGLRITAQQISTFIKTQLEVEYPISTELFNRPEYWPERAVITGFRERNKSRHYAADADLLQFLQKNPNPVFVTFGSMVNAQSERIGKDILEVAMKLQIPLIINSSWGGIVIPEHDGQWVHEVTDVPYDFLFPKVRAVIHHGGSGTTHSALRCEKPQAIIPHLGDQFFWNRCIAKEGKGVKGFPIKQWSQANFKQLLELLVSQN